MSLREVSRGRVWSAWALLFLLSSALLVSAQETPTPKVDIFAGYAWMDPGGNLGPRKLETMSKGFGVTSTFNLNKYLGISLDGGGHYSDTNNVGTIMAGPRVMWRGEEWQPFLHALVGLHRLSVAGLGTDNHVGVTVGGGFDIPVNPTVSIRVIEADYVWAKHNFSPALAGDQSLNGVRLRSGIVFKLGGGAPAPPLAASCSLQPAEVMAGEPVTLTVAASNIHKNHTVDYRYASSGGKAEGKGPTATVDTAGLAPGSYTVTATVSDPKDGSANCNSSFTIKAPPMHPPTVSCSANPSTVQSGEPSTITAVGESPDNRPLTYTFQTSAGRISPSGAQARLDTAGASAGPISIICTATDDRGLSASARAAVNVEVPPPPPQASKCGTISFERDKRRPTRVDNEAKATLDDCALRLQREADARGVIVGNADPKERHAQKMAEQRAVNTKDYLTREKGIDPARLEVRTGSAGAKSADIWVVPAGATFDEAGTQAFEATKVKAQPRTPPAHKAPAKKAAPAAKK
jgi:hypothetical protein